MKQRIRTRSGAEKAVIAALRPYGFQPHVVGDQNEPVASLRVGDNYFDVYIQESDGYPDSR